ncbi:MAG: tannase/feruloyl esterase family alpha/beta hydrolase, partial [Bryobacteraceae bacterium]
MKYSRYWMVFAAGAAALIWSAGVGAQAPAGGANGAKTISEADCTAANLGGSIPVSAIGEPVSAVTLSEPRWNASGGRGGGGPYCSVNGAIEPVDKSPNAKPINFQVALPATWNQRSAQLGGGGMNGTIPGLAGGQLSQCYVTYGSDSGHQAGFGGFGGGAPGSFPGFGGAKGGPGGPGGAKGGPGGAKGPGGPGAAKGRGGPNPADNWALNDEAIQNLGYAQ